VCLQQVNDNIAANNIYTMNTIEATQVNNTNTSDLILFIIVEDPDTMDLQIWYNIVRSSSKMTITLKQDQEEKIQASKGQIAARDERQDEILAL
jgi:hypothetical protein